MSNAEAWITGEYPNQKLNLKLPTGATGPQGPVGPIGPASTVPGPATELTVLDTVTGPETPGATGPQGVKGDKGDPGGFVLGTLITNNTDWNNLTTDGLYRTVTATGMVNAPPAVLHGELYVNNIEVGVGTRVLQTFYPAIGGEQGRVFYQRGVAGGVWQPWRSYNSTRVDQTAGRAIYQWDNLNNREQLIYGDTGWRDVSADLLNGATGSVLLRRIGYTTHISFSSLKLPSTAVSDHVITIPTAFTPGATFGIARETVNTGNAFGFMFSGMLMLYGNISGGANNTTHRFQGQISGVTTNAWPTTLPGTASGSIPNV